MPSLVDELRDERRCGCYADGSAAHHCVTCRAADRLEALGVAMRDLRLTAVLLLQNSQACVAQHHGSTSQPGWLRDCRLKIEAAEAVLKD